MGGVLTSDTSGLTITQVSGNTYTFDMTGNFWAHNLMLTTWNTSIT